MLSVDLYGARHENLCFDFEYLKFGYGSLSLCSFFIMMCLFGLAFDYVLDVC